MEFCPDPLPPPSGSAHGTGLCLHLLRYTENPFYRAHRLLYDTSRTFYRSTSREREREGEMGVLFEFRHFFLTQRTRLRISKIRVYLCKFFLIDELSLSDCITL